MEMQTVRRTLAGVGVGFLLATLVGSGVAVGAQLMNVRVVNQNPIPVAERGRTPFQWYGQIETAGTLVAEVPDGEQLTLTYITSSDSEGDFIQMEIANGNAAETQRARWHYRAEDLSENIVVHAPSGTDVWLFEGTTLDVEPYALVSGYIEPE